LGALVSTTGATVSLTGVISVFTSGTDSFLELDLVDTLAIYIHILGNISLNNTHYGN